MPDHVAAGRDTTRPPLLCPPVFVGRQREVALLGQALAAPPAVVLIEGEAGIGKSRLLTEYLSGQPQRALVACCPPFRRPHTLGPVTDSLRQAAPSVAGWRLSPLAGALRPLFPEWAADLPPAPEQADDASVARHRIFLALAEVLGCLRAEVLVAEDVQWADETTLEFLLYLCSRRPQQVSLVLTYRAEEVPAGSPLLRLSSRPAAGASLVRLALPPLDVAGTAGLVSSMLAGQPVSAEFAAFVQERTEGVPLAVEESVRLMGERDDLTRRDGEWVRRRLADIDVPPTIRDSVLERIGRFSLPAQAMLWAAAVLAEAAGETTLTAVSGLDAAQARAGLTQALGSGLLGQDARLLVSFRHVLAARAVYEAIPAPERGLMHQRAGEALEAVPPPPVAELARHFRAAGDLAKWRTYGEAAAERALASGDEATTTELIRDLISEAPAPSVVRLLDKTTFASLTDRDRHMADLVRVLRQSLDGGRLPPDEAGVTRFQVGRVLGLMSQHEASRAELEKAVPQLGHDPARAARAMNMLGWPYDTVSPVAAHLRWVRRAAKLTATLPPASALRSQVDRMTALLLLGEQEGWAEAAALPREGRTGEELRVITVGYLNAAELAGVWGHYSESQRLSAIALGIAEAHEYLVYCQALTVNQAHLDWFTGHWTGLAEQVRPMDLGSQAQPPSLDAVLIAGLLEAAAGSRAQAAERFRYVISIRKRQSEWCYISEPAAALASLALAEGRAGEALAVTAEPVAISRAKGVWLWAADVVPARVAALVATGQTAAAAELVSAFGRGLRGRDMPAAKGGLATSRAIVARAADPARAAGLFGRVAAFWAALPRPYDALLAREQQANCLLACGQTGAGAALLQQVYDGLSELGAAAAARRVADTLAGQGGEVKRPASGRPGYGDRLSPRELDVARLLVTGLTNRDIARQLFLSPKTVARHVESAMRKLGVNSRTALAVRVIGDGLAGGTPEPAAPNRQPAELVPPRQPAGLIGSSAQ